MLKPLLGAISILGTLLLIVALEVSFLTPLNGEICTKTENAAQASCAPHNLVFVSIWRIGEALNYYGPAITALATVAIALFTLTLWVATNRQEVFNREDKRAFIFVPDIFSLFEPDATTANVWNWRFRPVLRNIGRTPTKEMLMYVECEVRNTPLPPQYPFVHDPTQTASGVIAPQMDLNGGLVPRYPGPPVTPQDIALAQIGQKFIYVWGWIKYRDIFPRTQVHVTRYCYRITPLGNPFAFAPNTPGQPPTPGTMSFPTIHHHEGNSIDEVTPKT
ncbi:MAG TPA: hypothetical protein VFR68_07960 [Candidatus Dormibacteraeota bacterium]|nr:hypothetical protein [Candidatus Dormibacteraeota bacterium]